MKIIKKTVALALSTIMLMSSIPMFTVQAAENTPPSAPTGLLTNELENPQNADAPTFGWLVNDEDDNEVQTAYEIVITDEITKETVWNSGKVVSSEQSYIRCGTNLDDGRPYSWKVKTWDKGDEESPYSENAYFATGISNDKWGAEWISSGRTGANHYWYARYEKQLDTSKTIASVNAYFACAHDYELNVNGEYVGRGQSFDYASETRYQGWDITDKVKDGRLVIGLLNRYYGGGQGRAESREALLGHINIYYADGTKDTIVTDGNWKTSTVVPLSGSTKRNGEGDFVEEYNAQNVQEKFSEFGFDDSQWTAAAVIGAHPTSEFTNVSPELSKPTDYIVKPVSVTKLANGSTIADFGMVIPARPQIAFKNGTAGKQLSIQTGYVLNPDGSINASNEATQSTNMTYKYTQKNGEQTYNTWDHLAFRYIQIPECGETFTADTIAAKVVHTNVPLYRDSTFATSNKMLDDVYELMKRSSIYSIQNSFVDTPTREKGQFLQDSINISEASMATTYERAASKKAIEQFLASADRYWTGDEAGRYNSVYPNADGKRDIPDFSLNVPYWVWNYYMTTGDKATLEKAYPYIKATGDYITKYINTSTGLVTKLGGGDGSPNSYQYGIVDWPAVGRFGYDWSGTKAGARTTVNMLSKRALDVITLAAKELGNTADMEDMQTRSEDLKNAINEKLINIDGVYSDGLNEKGNQVPHVSQHATSYALAFDIAPEDKISKMSEYVSDMGMNQGPMTADILVKSLFNTDKNTAALKLMTEPSDNGWAKEVSRGYTFTWEAWNANSSENSQSHGWGSAAAADILENFAGVSNLEPGAKKIKIAPVYTDLTSLDASVSTQRGAVGVSYTRSDSSYEINITVPANVAAEISLPVIGSGKFVEKNGKANDITDKPITVGSGSYSFAYNGDITVLPEKVEYKEPLPEGIFGTVDANIKTYTWGIGESEMAASNGTVYSDKNDYADLTVSLAKGDSLNESVIWGASSVKEPNTNGQKSLADTMRYILVEPKTNGTFSMDIAFKEAASNRKNRIFCADLGENTDITELDFSKLQKGSYPTVGEDITSTGVTTKTQEMTAGHKYILYTYQSGSTISAMSYKYTGDAPVVSPTATPTVPPTIEPTATPTAEPSASPDTRECVKITADYDGSGRLLNVDFETITYDKLAPVEDTPTRKVMYWNSMEGMKPITVSEPIESPSVIPTAEPESDIIMLNKTTYPLVVGNKSKTDFSDWETRGSSVQLTAEVSGDKYTSEDITWQSENPEVATVTDSGKVRGRTTGFTKVYAILPNGEKKSCAISVIDNITRSTVQTIEFNTDSLTMAAGESAKLIPIINPKDIYGNGALDTSLAWSSSDESVAKVENGIVTAVDTGTAVVKAISNDIGRTAECGVTVEKNAAKVQLTAETHAVDMKVGESTQLIAQSDGKITWKSDNSFIADVDENGVVTAFSNSNVPVLVDNPNYKAGSENVVEASEKIIVFKDGAAQYKKEAVKLYATSESGEVETFEISVDDADLELIKNDYISDSANNDFTAENFAGKGYLANLHAPQEAITDNSVNILWNSSSKIDIPDLTAYRVYVNGKERADVTTLGYTVNDLDPSTEYIIKVEAVDSNGNVLAEDETKVTTKVKSQVVNVLDYGAKGNGKVMDTYAIQRAINNCPENGTVYLPKGYIFYSGALFLKSNMTLQVDGILMGSADSKDYPLVVTRWEGWKKDNQPASEWANTTEDLPDNHYAHASLINAGTYDETSNSYNVGNIVICGNGQINANGFKLAYNEGLNHKTGNGGIPNPSSPAIDQTIRGRAITIHNAQNVYIKDIQVAYSPSWTIHPIYCDSVTIDNIEVVSKGDGETGAADNICILNGDGIDPDSSTNVNIFNSYFYAGDDAVAVKTGRNKEGNDLNKPVRFLRITDCESNGSKGGFAVGSENASGVKDVLFQNLTIKNITLSHGIWFKTYWSRGGVSENVTIRDIDSSKPLAFVMNYATSENNPADTVPEYKDFTIENCNSSLTFEGFRAEKGHDGAQVHDITIRGCKNSGTIKYGYNFNIYGADVSRWNLSNTENINIYADGYLEDTLLRIKNDASKVYQVDNEAKMISIFEGTTAEEVLSEITSLCGGTQTYEFSTTGVLSDGDKLTVTSQDGAHTEVFVISILSAEMQVWDFAKFTTEVKTTENNFTEEYDGLIIAIANNGADSDHDKITTDGVYWRGGASSGNSTRYIAFTPDKDGTLYATGKLNSNGGRWGISTSLDVSSFAADSSTQSTSTATVSTKCSAGTTYYIYAKTRSATVNNVRFVPLG